jgi:diaminopimelate epimerase
MNVDFYKMHGAGNDFIVIDNRQGRYSGWEPAFIREICRQHTGIGADGLLMIENTPEADFRMRFYNSDGFEADMCVNGSRCICYLAKHLGLIGDEFTFLAGDGLHPGLILPGSGVKIRVLIKPVNDERTFPVDFKLPDSLYFKRFLNTGVPHVVLEAGNLSDAPVKEIGALLRFHAYYQPEGTNVNFVQVVSKNRPFGLKMRTFERGVDAETMSCGTGATAAALSFFPAAADEKSDVRVETPGGHLLVSFTGRRGEIFLEGPVKIVYKGTYFKEEF